jgi:hypothetical protein
MSDAPSSDAARALAERQLALLGRLADIGLRLAEALETDVLGTVGAADRERATLQAAGPEDVWVPLPVPAVFAGDPALLYARISRAIRLTLALQTRIQRGLDRPARETLSPVPQSRAGRATLPTFDDEEAPPCADQGLLERPCYEDRVDREDLADLPFAQAVAIICRDLGMTAAPLEAPALKPPGARTRCPATPSPSVPCDGRSASDPPPAGTGRRSSRSDRDRCRC